MKQLLKLAAMLVVGFPVFAGSPPATTDALTKLPLISSADSSMRLPDTQMCKSKMQADFYSPSSGKLNATVAWYSSNLSGFHKTHAYSVDRSQDTFYKADGTVIVSITGEPGKDGQDVDVHSILYGSIQPGLSEKQIVGLNAGHLVCN